MELPTWGRAPFACKIVYALLEKPLGFPRDYSSQKHPFLKQPGVNSHWVGERDFNLNQIPERFQARKGVERLLRVEFPPSAGSPRTWGTKKHQGSLQQSSGNKTAALQGAVPLALLAKRPLGGWVSGLLSALPL